MRDGVGEGGKKGLNWEGEGLCGWYLRPIHFSAIQ